MYKFGPLLLLLVVSAISAQTRFSNSKTKTLPATKDSLQISNVSISPVGFKVYHNNQLLSPDSYSIDFEKAVLVVASENYEQLTIHYTAYPDFLTQKYTGLDKNLIVPSSTNNSKLFRIPNRTAKDYKPFNGLNTQGSLARGVTVGNNQDAVTTSSLDLQISGKLSKDVSIRASISDSNIPIQKNGYSQQIEEFDRVFIELYTSQWALKAGDILLSNNETNFMQFDKKVAGLSVDVTPDNTHAENHFKASGALVRGRFTRNQFTGIDGNQGPYKLVGPNNESYIVILSGSETIYVNGRALKRGNQNDYIIDYNTAEVTFTTTFPITSNMRITAEFQYSDRNYTRFVSYNKAAHKGDKLEVAGYFYTESDAKNQPLQQNLSDEQKEVLAQAGNDPLKMISESAYPESYDENRILYRKIQQDGQDVFEFSQDETASLYSVTFSAVGQNNGSYALKETTAIGKIYEYLGPNAGDYAPIVQLVAPTKLQVAVSNIKYKPTAKTSFDAEIAFSDNDQNLFSSIDDENNQGIATKAGWSQVYTDKKWLLKSEVKFDYLEENFNSIQRIYNVEFTRDWNLQNPSGDQEFLRTELFLSNKDNHQTTYQFESLRFGDSFQGNKHIIRSNTKVKHTAFYGTASLLKNESTAESGRFLKIDALLKQDFKKTWMGAYFNAEDNQRTDIPTQKLSLLSQKFTQVGGFLGVGDSTKVHAKFGIDFRKNDSLYNNALTRVNNTRNYYIKSKLAQNKNAQIALFANYRTIDNVYFEDNNVLNSRVNYSQKLFENFVRWTSVYETSSGTSPQQEFAYVKTEPGQGYYTWIDYNGNGIQEFDEFEVAKFADQADYLRVVLPSVNYIKVNQTLFSQSFHINPSQWNKENGFKKIASQFYNQSFILVDTQKKKNRNRIDLNPFDTDNPDVLSLTQSFKNSFFFRRGLQRYSTTYSYSNIHSKSNLGIGFQESKNKLRQLLFQHKIGGMWLIDFSASRLESESISENYGDRNYQIHSNELKPVLTYTYQRNNNFSINYEYKDKDDTLGVTTLELHKLGSSYQYASPNKGAIFADFNLYKNTFTGDANSPIAYQMLEGLQPGDNFVWNLIVQKKLTSYLHLNLNYSGRKSEMSKTVHTGNIQVRAVF